ncbi:MULTISPECIES: ABC transporter family substrate-binding protein [Streptomyces]|uniref:ABC transporter family substrate-binding protein n=1 Tax=Streptomyces TaxID=1883 RepID=UPI000241B5F0|nr:MULTISPECIES: ABC transporter family substrate-binding protein [Streptomyces]EHM26109.1 putative lipoprotein [Streptomyces sp. W007]MCX4488784.1 ABC transporter family substrate-binding protein [Streptomyces anulatus]WSI80154.1 ABC transporter family substrate-binding protein [Streptomyces anulatus]WSU76106.1 ABC transporter family substrate-binding protein [Streptomyces anulatus]WTD25484.1 ABC transporter family substrate-binding protein [Streptomyces anulatus]
MSHVGVPRGTVRKRRSLALLTTGVLTIPVLAGCSSGSEETSRGVPQDIAPAARQAVSDGSTVNWAVDALPATFNAFQADADSATTRITGALLPSLFPMDASGQPKLNPDYLESAKIIEREPKQVVLYKLNQQAVWSDGREIGAPDFVAQWRALRGKDSAFWTARNSGYERIEKIDRGADDLQVRVTFSKPYADWRSLFSPLYPKEITGSPDAFNDGARTTLKNTAGPFVLRGVSKAKGTVTLARNPRWWGDKAKLDTLVFRAVAAGDRTRALADGTVDVADIDASTADRITLARRDRGNNGQPLAHGPGSETTPAAALRSWALAHGSDEEAAEIAQAAREKNRKAVVAYTAEQKALRDFAVRKSLEPAYTQLALNGESGPLADDRVRRAVARALDREELARTVLGPLGLPAKPLGSHLALAGQPGYKDGSGALGDQNTKEAQALLADAGWTRGGAVQPPKDTKAGSEAEKKGAKGDAPGTEEGAEKEAAEGTKDDKEAKSEKAESEKKAEQGGEKKTERNGEEEKAEKKAEDSSGEDSTAEGEKADRAAEDSAASRDEGLYIVGEDNKPGAHAPARAATTGASAVHVLAPSRTAAAQSAALLRQAGALGEDGGAVAAQDKQPGGAAGAYAPVGTAAPAPAAAKGQLGKDGKALTLRFVLPSGPGSQSLRSVGDKIAVMLEKIGIGTEIIKVPDESYFKDHVASGAYDLALYSWPATAYPATDGRPIYAKPEPATDGSLLVEQNYTRVGTDHIDQLFDQAAAELDEKAARELMKQADARIWAAAGSIPLFQRPQLVAVDKKLANVGAFGFAAPRYQDIGFKNRQAAGSPADRKK